MATKRFVVVSGFWANDASNENLPEISAEDFIACADAGYSICVSAGYKPDIVIGDFDSLSPEQISEIDALGIEKIVYPVEKNETDTLLCVRYGIAQGFDNFLILGGIGGDFAHTLANLQVLSFLTDLECKSEIITDSERLLMVDGELVSAVHEPRPAVPLVISESPGTKFSVFSYAERSTGVHIKNAKYELTDTVLTQSYPLGVSNEFINNDPVSISLKFGRLLIVIQTL
jgi:thiamine pyrophosphokinase